jgi:hypothetical protein
MPDVLFSSTRHDCPGFLVEQMVIFLNFIAKQSEQLIPIKELCESLFVLMASPSYNERLILNCQMKIKFICNEKNMVFFLVLNRLV